MKFLTVWQVRPGSTKEAVARFLAGKNNPPTGVTMLNRWHKADFSGGFTLAESNDPVALFADAAQWVDVVEIHSCPVIEDAEVGPVLASIFK